MDLLFTQLVEHPPVLTGRGIPLTFARTNVDVHRTEVVILLVTYNEPIPPCNTHL